MLDKRILCKLYQHSSLGFDPNCLPIEDVPIFTLSQPKLEISERDIERRIKRCTCSALQTFWKVILLNGTSRKLRLRCGAAKAVENDLVSWTLFSPNLASVSLRRISAWNGSFPLVISSGCDSDCLGTVSVTALVAVSPDRLFKASISIVYVFGW